MNFHVIVPGAPKTSLKIWAAAWIAATLASVSAQAQPKLPEGSINVDVEVVSNYIFRGTDVMTGQAQQRSRAYGAATGAPALQPQITYGLPVEGLTFALWGSFALTRRSDKDVDQAFQKGPGGSNLLISGLLSGGTPQSIVAGAYAALPGTPVSNLQPSNVPGIYKEQNGTSRADEFDYTLGYDNKTQVGRLIFGYSAYTLSNPNKGAGGLATNEPYYGNEMYIGYGLRALPDLTLTLYGDTRTGGQYWKLGYAAEAEDFWHVKGLALLYGISAGYAIKSTPVGTTASGNEIKGWQDITVGVGLKFKVTEKSGLKVGFNAAYRPDLSLVDPDTGVRGSATLPLWIDGESTIADGRAADPSKTNGWANALVNTLITNRLAAGNPNFVYTPRQRLPRTLWWINAGYTADL